jgi:hypothetical protein
MSLIEIVGSVFTMTRSRALSKFRIYDFGHATRIYDKAAARTTSQEQSTITTLNRQATNNNLSSFLITSSIETSIEICLQNLSRMPSCSITIKLEIIMYKTWEDYSYVVPQSKGRTNVCHLLCSMIRSRICDTLI